MKKILVKIISIYQKTLSPDQGFFARLGIIRRPVCVFYPTCSQYAKESIIKHGVLKGLFFSIKRILRCHPWQKNHIDPVK